MKDYDSMSTDELDGFMKTLPKDKVQASFNRILSTPTTFTDEKTGAVIFCTLLEHISVNHIKKAIAGNEQAYRPCGEILRHFEINYKRLKNITGDIDYSMFSDADYISFYRSGLIDWNKWQRLPR